MKKQAQIEIIESLIRAIENNSQELWNNDLSQGETAVKIEDISNELEALKKLINENKK